MYNRFLDTFLVVADCGSFSQAAERLHISSTAISKQIVQLEHSAGVQLFRRTSHGVFLTEAGIAFRDESRKLVYASQEALQRVRRIERHSERQICFGNTILRPANYFLDLWLENYGKPLEYKINIVPFLDNSYTDYLDVVARLGKEIDVIAGMYSEDLGDHRCNTLEITRMPFCIAIPSGHRLREKVMLEVSDLCGEDIIILEQGRAGEVDQVRSELEKYADIRFWDVSDYEPATFNRCETTNRLLLTYACWADVHPMLKTLPVNWSYGGSYRLLYSLEPSEDTQMFIESIRRTLNCEYCR